MYEKLGSYSFWSCIGNFRVDRGNSGREKKPKNHVFDVTASTHRFIVASGMHPATSAKKLTTFQQSA